MRFYLLHKSEPMRVGTRTGDLPTPWKVWQVGRFCFEIAR